LNIKEKIKIKNITILICETELVFKFNYEETEVMAIYRVISYFIHNKLNLITTGYGIFLTDDMIIKKKKIKSERFKNFSLEDLILILENCNEEGFYPKFVSNTTPMGIEIRFTENFCPRLDINKVLQGLITSLGQKNFESD
jgi:hypothetical protein